MKRFTETLKWSDPWFRSLKPKHKLLWLWLVDNCDMVGLVQEIDWQLLSFQAGEQLSQDDLSALGDRVQASGKLVFIPKFIAYQYGDKELNPKSKVHIGLAKAIVRVSKAFPNPYESLFIAFDKAINSLKDKDKDKDKEKDTECSKEEVQEEQGLYWPNEIYAAYPRKTGRGAALKAIQKAIKSGKKPTELLEATQAYARAVARWPEEFHDYIPHPATWYNRESYDDDRSTWEKTDRNGRNGNKPEPQNVIRPNLNAPMPKTTMELMLEAQEAGQ